MALTVWLTRCGLAAQGASVLYVWATSPTQSDQWNLPADCQQWNAAGTRCESSLMLWSLHDLEPCGGYLGFTVLGEPEPDRLTPVLVPYEAHTRWNRFDWYSGPEQVTRFDYRDIDFSASVNAADLDQLTAWVLKQDRRGDWNFDGVTDSLDLAAYVAAGVCCR